MYRSLLALSLSALALSQASAQSAPATSSADCGCRQNFDRTVELIQANYAGYSAKVTPATKPRLDSLTAVLRKRAEHTSPLLCSAVLLDWLRFFKDGHLQIDYVDNYLPSPAEVRANFANWEKLDWTDARLRAYLNDPRQPKAPVEGIWRNAAGNYQLGIVPAGPGQWKAFIVRADSAWWTPGQVKATLKAAPDGGFAATYYMQDHTPQSFTAQLTADGQLQMRDQWYRLYPNPVSIPASKVAVATAPVGPARKLSFTMLDDTTALYRIPSFSGKIGAAVDSVTKANADNLKRTRLLIIDMRGNGGGSDHNYASLTPLLYTNPIRTIGVEHLATEENIKKYAFYRSLPGMCTPEQERAFAKAEAMQRAQLGKFVNLAKKAETVHKLRGPLPYPARVAVLQDDGCGSSAEQFLLEVNQSKKATTFGSNTAGVLDYANMYFAPLPCGHLQLGWATSRSMRVPRGQGIDNVGIAPKVRLDPTASDMVEQVRAYYRRK